MNPTPQQLPERIGRYRIVERIGQGGMGDVLLAQDERLHRPVAIKRLKAGLSSELYARLEREALATAQLSHPAVVRIFEALDMEDGVHLVLEYVRGQTVFQSLKQGPLPLDVLLALGREVAEALSEAHEKGILHRDLKSENVMVTDHGHAKILDFGLAKAWSSTGELSMDSSPLESEESLTHTGWILGTGRSMAPEQARGEPLDARSDLFSLGVLLYEMATAVSPFRGQTQLETLSNLLTVEPEPVDALRPQLPAALVELIHRLTAKDPNQRPEHAGSVGRVLGRLEADSKHGQASEEGAPTEPAAPNSDRSEPVHIADTALGDLPTGYARPAPSPERPSANTPAPVPEPPPPPEKATTVGRQEALSLPAPGDRSFGDRLSRKTGRRVLAVVVSLVAATAILMMISAPSSKVRRVAVLEPQVISPDPEGRLAILGAGALDAAIGALVDLEQTGPVGPDQLRGVEGSPLHIASAHAADEVLVIKLLELGAVTHIELRRWGTEDGIVHWSRNLPISSQLEDALQTANLVSAEVKRGFREGRSLPWLGDDRAESRLQATAHDYRRFLEIQHRARHQHLPFPEAIQQLEEILATSPRLRSAHWLVADLSESLFSDTRQAQHLETAQRHIRLAGEGYDWDPRPAIHGLRLALLAGRLDEATQLLETVSRIAPGDPEALFSSALLAQARGRTEEAITILRRLVAQRPSWRYLHQLATLESRSGQVDSARSHFRQLLERSPDNTWGLNGLLQLETLHGNLNEAEGLALRLLELKPHRSFWNNLGIVRFLLGNYEQAIQAYEQAAELSPDHPTTLLNLGDSLQAMGRDEEAEQAFRRALSLLDQRQQSETLGPYDRLTRAQCSAHLGDFEGAIEETLATLEFADEDSELAYQAALVFALAGEQQSALIKAKHALGSGMDARWFHIPAFDDLRPVLFEETSSTGVSPSGDGQ